MDGDQKRELIFRGFNTIHLGWGLDETPNLITLSKTNIWK